MFSKVVNAASEMSTAKTCPREFSAMNLELKPDPGPTSSESSLPR